MDQTIISSAENDDRSLSLQIDNESLKHIFYMLHGEPTTRTQCFTGAILVNKTDIEQLVDSLVEQLHLTHVRDYTITVGVGFKKQLIEKSFEKFKKYKWTEPERTEEITIKLHFLYEDYESGNPLKHSFLVRIAKGIKPGNVLQLLATNDTDKLDNLENFMCPVFCRSDHVNDKLSKDLLSVVENWHAGQKQPRLLSGAYEFLRKHKRQVAIIVHYAIPTSVAFILCYFAFVVPFFIIENQRLPTYIALLIMSKILIEIFMNVSSSRANKVFNNLSKLSNEDVIFDITKGDDKDYAEIIDKNRDLFTNAKAIFIWTNIQAISASIMATVIFEILKKALA